jgi:hypothetical protein
MEYGLNVNTKSSGVLYQPPIDVGILDFGSVGPDGTNRLFGESDTPIQLTRGRNPRTGTTDLCVTDDFC